MSLTVLLLILSSLIAVLCMLFVFKKWSGSSDKGSELSKKDEPPKESSVTEKTEIVARPPRKKKVESSGSNFNEVETTKEFKNGVDTSNLCADIKKNDETNSVKNGDAKDSLQNGESQAKFTVKNSGKEGSKFKTSFKKQEVKTTDVQAEKPETNSAGANNKEITKSLADEVKAPPFKVRVNKQTKKEASAVKNLDTQGPKSVVEEPLKNLKEEIPKASKKLDSKAVLKNLDEKKPENISKTLDNKLETLPKTLDKKPELSLINSDQKKLKADQNIPESKINADNSVRKSEKQASESSPAKKSAELNPSLKDQIDRQQLNRKPETSFTETGKLTGKAGEKRTPKAENSAPKTVENNAPKFPVKKQEQKLCASPRDKERSVKVTEAEKMTPNQQEHVRVLTLNQDQHLDSIVFRFKKGHILQLRPGPTLFGKKVSVYTNHPINASSIFERKSYRKLPWEYDSLTKGDDTSLYVKIPIHTAGSFHFYFTLDESETLEKSCGSGYFLVDPTLTRGPEKEELPLDCVQCQTVMTKCLGTMNRWLDCLRVTKESGYNMIHFTPVQELGASNSGYSLADQLKLNPNLSTPEKIYNMLDLENIVVRMKNEWKILSLTDIVLNHTANESVWIKEHPECGYNMDNCPHLRPAYVLDRALVHFSKEVSDGKWEDRGIPATVCEMHHVEAIRHVLFDIFSANRVEEFYMVNVEKILETFVSKMKETKRTSWHGEKFETLKHQVKIIQDEKYKRLQSSVDFDLALKTFHTSWPEISDEKELIKKSCSELRNVLEFLNHAKREEINGHLRQAVDCSIGTICYERVQQDGPKYSKVTAKHPLTAQYFTHPGPTKSLKEDEEVSYGPEGRFIMAHNGWVMGFDPMKNFALKGSNVYIRRELIAWGDSVKLRFGDCPSDCPFLWNYMREYVEETARIFHGIRLDNCHSTPIHVAEYLLDCARRVRPDLYVVAELFTNSQDKDNVFVNRLGINSLIREAMSAPDSHEEGRLVYLYGGEPVGAFLLPPVRPLAPAVAHAIFLDMTHDNKSPCEVRSWWDMLPSTALVNMACCASGSNRGYDEIVPHHIHVVNENRKYTMWGDTPDPSKGTVNQDCGIIKGKKALNDLHYELGLSGFNEVFVDQVTEHVVTVTRHNPVTHQSVVLMAYTAFKTPSQIGNQYVRPLKVQGKVEEIIFEMLIEPNDKNDFDRKIPGSFKRTEDFVNGSNDFNLIVNKSVKPDNSHLVQKISPPGADTTEFRFSEKFRPGCVIAFKLSLLPEASLAVGDLRSILNDFTYQNRISQVSSQNNELLSVVNSLGLSDLNRVLYRCNEEEQDEGRGGGTYKVPNYRPFVYCGLQGLMSELSKIRISNDLGHPICGNLRDGDWLTDYIVGRLSVEKATKPLGDWLGKVFKDLKKVPRYLIPAYFDAIIAAVYFILINKSWNNLGRFISEGSDFAKYLGLCSVQFCGVVKSSLLPPLSSNLSPPLPPISKDKSGKEIQTSVTLSAGLPHFSVGYLRNWGRDTFIALPGNLLITERFQEARWIILAFASTLRHGLIPNLLDGGYNARYNCRDAVWFWLYSILKYVELAPEGHKIFQDKISRMYPTDEAEAQPVGAYDQPLGYVIQEALETHFKGLKFRERNAGYKIDSQMKDEGFNVEIGVDKNTGFPFGGNLNNCGTWMDKMGSSEKAGNKGIPSTPRDGSPVEIVGLCKAVVRFLAEMHKKGHFPYSGVEMVDKSGLIVTWSYTFWEDTLQKNFETLFWINDTPNPKYETQPQLINRRGIYKDVFGSQQPWADFQLRCNFPIAMAVAPDLFTPEKAWIALENVEKILLGLLGVKTLDPSDWKYCGNYDNSNDSHDSRVAKGANYHQGPEWLWPVGFFLRAKLEVSKRLKNPTLISETKSRIKSILSAHFTHITTSLWRSLPELTNENGNHCPDSNPAQSWSTGCILEVLYDMHQTEK